MLGHGDERRRRGKGGEGRGFTGYCTSFCDGAWKAGQFGIGCVETPSSCTLFVRVKGKPTMKERQKYAYSVVI